MSVGVSWFLPGDFESDEKYQAAKARKVAAEKVQAIVDATIRAETNAREAPDLAAAGNAFLCFVSSWRPREPAAPESGSQGEVDLLERKLSIAHFELDDFLQRTRYDGLQRELESGNLVGSALVNTQRFLTGWRPVVEKLRRTFQELSQEHRDLVARRRKATSASD
jgi:hypothetical protein